MEVGEGFVFVMERHKDCVAHTGSAALACRRSLHYGQLSVMALVEKHHSGRMWTSFHLVIFQTKKSGKG